MRNEFIDIYLMRHGAVEILHDQFDRRKLHAVDIPLNAEGQVNTYKILAYIDDRIKKDMHAPYFEYIITSPKIRCMQTAWISGNIISSVYKEEDSFNMEVYKATRYFNKSDIFVHDPYSFGGTSLERRKKEVIAKELQMELLIRKLGIITEDRLDDILAPPVYWEGLPVEIYQEVYKEFKPDKILVQNAAQVIMDCIERIKHKKKKGLLMSRETPTQILLTTHENTGISLLSYFNPALPDPWEMTMKEMNKHFPFSRGECYRMRFTAKGEYVESEFISLAANRL